jgi:hypothetical protein
MIFMRWKAHATRVGKAHLFAVAHAFQRVKAETNFLTIFIRRKAHAWGLANFLPDSATGATSSEPGPTAQEFVE